MTSMDFTSQNTEDVAKSQRNLLLVLEITVRLTLLYPLSS